MFYSIIALIIRVVLSYLLFQKGKLALESQTRNLTNIFYLVSAVSILAGVFTNVTTLILLIYLGIRVWKRKQRNLSITKELILLFLTFIIFLKTSGDISIDKLMGNI